MREPTERSRRRMADKELDQALGPSWLGWAMHFALGAVLAPCGYRRVFHHTSFPGSGWLLLAGLAMIGGGLSAYFGDRPWFQSTSSAGFAYPLTPRMKVAALVTAAAGGLLSLVALAL